MGVKNINKIIGKYSHYVPLKNYQNKRIGVDARNWMYRFLRSPAYSHHKYPILKGFVNQINTFAKYNISPIYVFDGKASEEKLDTLQKRKNQHDSVVSRIELYKQELERRGVTLDADSILEMINDNDDVDVSVEDIINAIDGEGNIDLSKIIEDDNGDVEGDGDGDGDGEGEGEGEEGDDDFKHMTAEDIQNKIESLTTQTLVPTYKDTDLCKRLFAFTGVKYISAQGEADEVLGMLYKKHEVDAILSADMDLLAYGVSHLLTDLKSASKGGGAVCKEYILSDILSDFKWSHEQFVDFCLLCGCDYIDRIPWLGCKTAKKYIDTHLTVENVVTDIKKKKKGRIRLEDEETQNYMDKVIKSRRIFSLAQLDQREKQEESGEKNEGGIEKYSDEDKTTFFITYDLPKHVPYVCEPPPSRKKPKVAKKDKNQQSIANFFQ